MFHDFLLFPELVVLWFFAPKKHFESNMTIDSRMVVGSLADRLNLKDLKLLGRTNKHYKSSVRLHLRERSPGMIQCLWRRRGWRVKTKYLAESYLAAKLSDADARAFDFDVITKHLRAKCVVITAKSFLFRLMFLAMKIGGVQPQYAAHNVRVFLAAYLARYFPQEVFDNMLANERDLLDKSVALLACVHPIVAGLALHGSFRALPGPLTANYLRLLYAFEQSFWTWKGLDQVLFIRRIRNTTYALLDAMRLLDPYERLDEPLRNQFRAQVRRMFGKLAELHDENHTTQFDPYRFGTLSYETFDAANPVDWELWANHHAENVFAMLSDEYWALWANVRVTRLLF